jgi:hypothetical protein
MAYPTITERDGSLSATGIAKEVTFGTPVTATTFLPMLSNTMEVDPGWFSPELMMATRDLHVFNLYGQAVYTGAVAGPFFPSNAATLLAGSIGTDVVTGSANPWTHTISQANTLPSFTIEKNLGNYQSIQFAGCRVGKMTLNVPATNEAANVSYDATGQSAAILTSPTAVTVVNESPFVFAEGSLTLFTHARAEVTSASITIDNGLKSTYTFSGNHGPSFITPVTLHVSGSITLTWSSLNDSTYGDFTNLVNGTLGALSISLTHPGATGASLTITCPQVVLSKMTEDVKMTDVIMSNLTFEATKSLSSGYTVQAVLLNAISTAY